MREYVGYAGIIVALFLTGLSLLAVRQGARNAFRLYGVLAMTVLFTSMLIAGLESGVWRELLFF
jgi:hypothetical protein